MFKYKHYFYIGIFLLIIYVISKSIKEKFKVKSKKKPKLSFIILRHVGDESQNLYWNVCYDNIRNLYNNVPIYIIDDNSKFNPYRIGEEMKNTKLIKSDFLPNRGELLPYYYFHKYKFSRNTVILHDTVFIHKRIDSSLLQTKTYHFLWSAKHNWDSNKQIISILNKMNNNEYNLNLFYKKNNWDVCFGGLAILNIDYINSIFDNNNYFKVLLDEINTRKRRMYFERIISVLLTRNIKMNTVNGDIHVDQKWGTKYNTYHELKNITSEKNMSKVWLGREGSKNSFVSNVTNIISKFFSPK
tara:strand:+ start:529 stop:1428 length:900 start_codon:yes stop_codon:yes gene_type:complete